MQFDPLLDDFDKGKYEFRENHIFIRCHVCLILCNVCPPFIRFLSMYAIRNTESALTNMCVSVCVCAFVCVCVCARARARACVRACVVQCVCMCVCTRVCVCVCLRAIGALYMNLTFPLLNVPCMSKPSFVHFCFLFVTGHLLYGTQGYKQLNLIYFFLDKEAY